MIECEKQLHVVFLTAEYLPNPSQLGACVANVVPILQAKGLKVTVIASGREDQLTPYEVEGQTIIPVFSRLQLLKAKCSRKGQRLEKAGNLMQSKVFGKVAQLIFLLDRSLDYLKSFYQNVNINRGRTRAFFQALDHLKDIQVIIPTCFPIEAVAAAYSVSHSRDIRLMPYFLDPFADNVSLHRTEGNQNRKYNNHLNFERSVLGQSERVLLLEHLSQHFKETFPNFIDKFIEVEHPMLVDIRQRMEEGLGVAQLTEGEGDKTDKKLKLYCAGSFNQKIRTPNYLISILGALAHHIPLQVDFYTAGDCEKVIREAARHNPDVFKANGFIAKQEADLRMLRSDVLVHVCNKNRNQSPSKIYEYFSSGLPLINFYYNDDDPLIEKVRIYPLGINIKIHEGENPPGELTEVVDQLVHWLADHAEQCISFSEVKNLYSSALPEKTAATMLQVIYSDNF